MHKNVIGLRKCRMNNDRADEKLVYIYVNSRAMKQAGEVQRQQRIAETKEIYSFELPKLQFDSGKQDPYVYGSLGHEPLIFISFDAFVANDHVPELQDLTIGLLANEHRVEEDSSTSSHPLSGIGEEAELSMSDEGDNRE
jgi:hypothetical protein